MGYVIDAISNVMSFLMSGCYYLIGNYGFSLILFTLLTKVILFPINLFIQKNSIKMIKLQPELDALKIKYIDDKDKYIDARLKLYKENHYHSSLGIIPLVIQLIFVMGLLGVIYQPLTYILRIDDSVIEQLRVFLNVENTESSYQLQMIDKIHNITDFNNGALLDVYNTIKAFDTNLLGFDLGVKPTFSGNYIQLLIPVLAGLSAWIMCVVQNRINILQITAGNFNKYGMTVFMILFSTYFAYLVPAGVGIYWTLGNLFAIPAMVLTNVVVPPKKHIDFEYLRRTQEKKKQREEIYKKYHKKEKEDYKRFCSEKNMKLMFYSEQNGFYKYYAGIIDYICEHSDIDIHYVTSDPEDNIFKDERKQIYPYYISRDKYIIPLFMKLDCDIVVMTMPDLEKYHIKRSRIRNDIEYLYVCNGMGSSALTLRKGALDWYDTVFCVGVDAVNEIREMEKLYKTKEKRLVETGYILIDEMIEKYEKLPHKENNPKKILIAPSWQPDNIIDLCADKLLDNLSKTDLDIILRPHPQHVKNDPDKFDILKEQYEKEGGNITIQTDFSSNSPIMEADVLITDWSDICWEYAFTTKKPTIFINTPMKIMNSDYDKIETVPINISLRDEIGKSIDPDKIDGINALIEEILNNYESYAKHIDEIFHERFFNIGNSVKLSGKYIIRQLEKK